jgi:hypothetical protein
MTILIAPLDLRPGDHAIICGRPETVTRVQDAGEWVHVYTVGDDGDAFLFRHHDAVPVTQRATT